MGDGASSLARTGARLHLLSMLLPNVEPDSLLARQSPVDDATLASAALIVGDVQKGGEASLRHHAERLGDLAEGAPLVVGRDAMNEALRSLPEDQRSVLRRARDRIRTFAERQREALSDLDYRADSGFRLGHEVAPVERAGCYAPGGRFPLPSSVLMTAATARAAGVEEVWVASPRPQPTTLAAAALAGADAVLAVGGAQAVAALAYGAGPVPPCDVIVGPGNKWVTAAKKLVAGVVSIDMLAGPSEVLIIADESASPSVVAADLLAQCEHDVEARGVLVSTSPSLVEATRVELSRQLETLPTRGTAQPALENHSAAVVVSSLEEACKVSNGVAPEHLEVLTEDPLRIKPRLRHYGALFLGAGAAEVLGDYGVGPNHTLPTGGTARTSGGLSVFDFLRIRTFISGQASARAVIDDAVAFARLEGLEAHARSAEARLEESE